MTKRNVAKKTAKANQPDDTPDEFRGQSFNLATKVASAIHAGLRPLEDNLGTLHDIYLCLDPDEKMNLHHRLENVRLRIQWFSEAAKVYDRELEDISDDDDEEVVRSPRRRRQVAHS